MSSLINIHEERHRLARKIFHGHQLRQRYREGQEDQLSAFTAPTPGRLRPLRDASAIEDEEGNDE